MGKKPNPFVSVIIPTYNRSELLRKAINSLFLQDFRDFEVIVVDDGSTDDTEEVIRSLQWQDNRLVYLKKNNEERSIARNHGIAHASGAYVNFLDSDDIVYRHHLGVAHALLERNEFPEVGHLGFELISPSGSRISVRNDLDNTVKHRLIHENILHGNAIFIRADVARIINFVPSKFAIISEDWYLWLRLAARYKFYFDNTVTSAVVQHDQRSLNNIDPIKLIKSTTVIVDHLRKDEVFMKAYKGQTNYHFANHYTLLTLILALSKSHRWKTVQYLLKALSYDLTVSTRRRFWASIKHLV